MTDIRQTRRRLWLVAQDFINVLSSLFGQPEALAARLTILRPEWRLIRQSLARRRGVRRNPPTARASVNANTQP